jgi:hypothetical protein
VDAGIDPGRLSIIGVAAQWESAVAVRLRNTALRLLPRSSFIRSLAPVLDWAPENTHDS